MNRVEIKIKWTLKAGLGRHCLHKSLTNGVGVVRGDDNFIKLVVDGDVVAVRDPHLKRVRGLRRCWVPYIPQSYRESVQWVNLLQPVSEGQVDPHCATKVELCGERAADIRQ